jgi:peroxiredoxin
MSLLTLEQLLSQLISKSACLTAIAVACLHPVALFAGSPQASQAPRADGQEMAVGASLSNFSLPGTDGKLHRLAEYSGSRILAIVFESNDCPVSQLYEDRIRKLAEDFRGKGVTLIAVNPNDPKVLRFSEQAYSDVGEDLEDMKVHAAEHRITWPYLSDSAQTLTSNLKPTATPEIFLFDSERKLRYRGRIDDNLETSEAKSNDARVALDALLAGQAPLAVTTPVAGCAIDWPSQESAAQAELAQVEAQPVTLSLAQKEDLKKLRNNPTGKLLLVNFWATWCGPCVTEFGNLQQTFRIFHERGLEFTMVSVNDPEEKASVLDFMKTEHATSRNLIFGESDVYGMEAAFDPGMEGPVPATILLDPHGEVLYQQIGDLDVPKIRQAILQNLPDPNEYPGEQAYWSAIASGSGSK